MVGQFASAFCLTIALFPGFAAAEGKQTPAGHCRAEEQVFFNCSVGKDPKKQKFLSVCGSKDLAKDKGYLQYRFGPQGKIELEFPKDRRDSAQVFQLEILEGRISAYRELAFKSKGTEYRVFYFYEMQDEQGEKDPKVEYGVFAGKTKILCGESAEDSIWSLKDIVPEAGAE